MSTSVKYDSFPPSIVAVRAGLLALTLTVGAVIFSGFGWTGLVAYLVLAVAIIGINMTLVCRHCAYRGFRCDSGLSCLATLLIGQAAPPSVPPTTGDGEAAKRFVVSARWVYPWFMLLLAAPLLVGGVQVVLGCAPGRWPWVAGYLVLLILVLATTVRLACPHCRMADICPLVGGGTSLADLKQEIAPDDEIIE